MCAIRVEGSLAAGCDNTGKAMQQIYAIFRDDGYSTIHPSDKTKDCIRREQLQIWVKKDTPKPIHIKHR